MFPDFGKDIPLDHKEVWLLRLLSAPQSLGISRGPEEAQQFHLRVVFGTVATF